jgi:hypothetical protein
MEFISLLKMAILNSLAAGVATKHPMGGIYRSSRSNIGRTPTLLCTLSYARAGSISIHEIHGVFYIVSMPRSSRSKSKSAHTGASSTTKVRLISSRTVYRGPAFWVTTDEVQEPGGVRARRDIVHHTGSVVVLAVDESRSLREGSIPAKSPFPRPSASCWKKPDTPPRIGGASSIFMPAPGSSPKPCRSIWPRVCAPEKLNRRRTRSSKNASCPSVRLSVWF